MKARPFESACRTTLIAILSWGAVLLANAGRCHADSSASRTKTQAVKFVDVAKEAGIVFQHDNAASPEKYLIETMGSGATWLDYDSDGLLDAYLVNSAATRAYSPAEPLRNALYKNKGDGTFQDVTAEAGVAAEELFGTGVAVGDYDNDGAADIFVTGYPRSIRYRNQADGTFADVTHRAGVENPHKWGSSAAWFDYDNDGRLDLVVANYLDWTEDNNIFCGEKRPGYQAYCHPNKYKGQTPTLFHNNGDGTFRDVSEESGIGERAGNGLGVVCFDFDDDGWMDVFIANDSMMNFLYRNRGDGTFEDVTLAAGVAFGEDGKAEAGMGVDAADYDGDGRLDLYLTHLDFEFDRLYRNLGDGSFEDATFLAKIGYQTFDVSGFGTRFIDYDHDGLRDIFVVNGHVLDNVHLFHEKTTYAEPKLVFRNTGNTFKNVTSELGADLSRPRVSRAAAFADYDNDGDIDVLVNNNGQGAELLRNDGGNGSHWLQIRLIGTKSNRDGVGARVQVAAGDLVQFEQQKGGMSYQSAHDPRLHFGLGKRTKVDLIEVRWPSGTEDLIKDVNADRVVVIREGNGRAETMPAVLNVPPDTAGRVEK